MALPTSKGELIEYSLRQLGKPVINIEIDEEQSSDNVDYAMKKFVDRHYDGATESFYLKILKREDVINGYVTGPSDYTAILNVMSLASEWSIEPFDSIEYYTMWDYTFGYGAGSGSMSNYYISRSHLALINFMMGSDNTFIYNTVSKRLNLTHNRSHIGSGNQFVSPTLLETTDWTRLNSVITDKTVELPNGKVIASTITSDVAGIFGFSQNVESKNYIRGTHSVEVELMSGTYTGSVDIIIEDRNGTVAATKTIALTSMWTKFDLSAVFDATHINDINVRFETTTAAAGAGETFFVYNPNLYVNAFIVLHGYKAIDSETFEDVWSQEWLLKYVTALQKKQWGSNVKKYSGVQLPGGIEMNGQIIFDEAVAELEKLDEQFSMEYELPVDFFMG